MATHSSILAWKNPMDFHGHGIAETQLSDSHTHTHMHTGSEHVNTCLVNTCLVNVKAEMGVMCLQVKEGKGSPANHVNYERGPEEILTHSLRRHYPCQHLDLSLCLQQSETLNVCWLSCSVCSTRLLQPGK